MNPIANSTPKPGQTLVRDVTPPGAQPPPKPAQFKPEVVGPIPVQNPIGGANVRPSPIVRNPLVQAAAPAAAGKEDKELEHILKDASSSVKQSEDASQAKTVRPTKAPKKSSQDSPPIAVTLVACLVALLLTAGAIMVFNSGA